MEQAFDCVLRKSAVVDAKHVYCMGDGDISPFTVQTPQHSARLLAGRKSWTDYRAEFPHITFEFGLLGNKASSELTEMGMIGGGGFRHLGAAG